MADGIKRGESLSIARLAPWRQPNAQVEAAYDESSSRALGTPTKAFVTQPIVACIVFRCQ